MKWKAIFFNTSFLQSSILFCLIFFLFLLSNSYLLTWNNNAPPGTQFTFIHGHSGDYYQFLHFIRSGTQKKLLYDIPYTEHQVTPIILQPVYYLAGYLFSPFTSSPIVILLILRFIAWIIFSISVVKLINNTLNSFPLKLVALIIIVSATGILTVLPDSGLYSTAIDWNDTFHIFRKFLIPPHHLLAISCIILLFIEFSFSKRTKRQVFLTTLLTIVVGFLHTFHLSLIVFTIGLWSVIQWIVHPKTLRSICLKSVPILIAALGVYVYYYFATSLAYPWTNSENNSKLFLIRPLSDYIPYFQSEGIPLLLSVFFFIPLIRKKVNTLSLLLFFWAVIPFVLYPFRISEGFMQPFKTHQYIPLSLLSVIGIQYLIKKKMLFVLLVPLIVTCSLLYAIPAYVKTLQQLYHNVYTEATVYIPNDLTHAFNYLMQYTSPKSVVLSGHDTSFMIPAYTHNKVIIGQGNSIPNYEAAVAAVEVFCYEPQSMDEKKAFLDQHHVSYILFTSDCPQNEQFKSYPFLHEVFISGKARIVQVLR